MRRSGYIERHTPLRSTVWGIPRREEPKRAGTDRDDPAYKAFVRTLACINCQAPAPSDPAHVVTASGQKGLGLKVDDRQCVPLCRKCHDFFDGNTDGPDNPFRYWQRERKRIEAARWIAATQRRATPGDLERALELQERGLGTVLKQVHGAGWAWASGPTREMAA